MVLFAMMCGCATLPARQPQVAIPRDSGQLLLDEWQARNSRNHSLQGLARVRVQSPERSMNGSQVLLVEEPARLRAETLSPFGTPLLVMTANDTELSVLVPGDNLFYRGKATAENLSRFTRLPLRLAELVGILLSRPPMISYHELQAFNLADGGCRLELQAGRRRQELQFDSGRRLTGVRYFIDDTPQLYLVYGDFDQSLPALPRQIDLELPQHQTRVELVFRELEANRELQASVFALQPPEGATVTSLDEPTDLLQPPSRTELK